MVEKGAGRADSVSCDFLHLLLHVQVVLTRGRLGIAICADFSLGSDLLSRSLDDPSILMNCLVLLSSSVTTKLPVFLARRVRLPLHQ
jgi:hypothetical protein